MTTHLRRLQEKVNELYALEEEILSEESLELAVYEACEMLESLGYEVPDTFTVEEVSLTMDQVRFDVLEGVAGEVARSFKHSFQKLGGAIKGALKSATPKAIYHKHELEKHKKAMHAIRDNPNAAFDKKAHAQWRTHAAELHKHWKAVDPKNAEDYERHLAKKNLPEPGSEKDRKRAFLQNPHILHLRRERDIKKWDDVRKGKKEDPRALKMKARAVKDAEAAKEPTQQISAGEVAKEIQKRHGKWTGADRPAVSAERGKVLPIHKKEEPKKHIDWGSREVPVAK